VTAVQVRHTNRLSAWQEQNVEDDRSLMRVAEPIAAPAVE
jgi:hypothetical protein